MPSADFPAKVLKHAAVGITVQDAEGRIVYANDAAARSVGFASAEQMLAMPGREIVEKFEMLDESRAPFALERLPGRRALAGERDPEAVVGYRTRGERGERWSVVRATLIEDENARYAVNAWYDVTRYYGE